MEEAYRRYARLWLAMLWYTTMIRLAFGLLGTDTTVAIFGPVSR